MTKLDYIKQIEKFATIARKMIIGTTDPAKLAGFVDKASDARIFLETPEQDPDESILKGLIAECDSRGRNETPTQLALIQITKANQLKYFRGKLDGLEDRLKTGVSLAISDEHAKLLFEYGLQIAISELTLLGIDGNLIYQELLNGTS